MDERRGPAFRAATARVVIRCWTPDDAEAFRALLDRNDQHLRPFIPWMRDEPATLEQTRARLARYERRFHGGEDFRFAWLTPDDVLIGELIMSTRQGPDCREIGYLLDRDATGQGYALEASSMAVRLAFEVDGVSRVQIHCCPDNRPSLAVPTRLGFTHLRTDRLSSEDSEGVLRDSMSWELRRQDYPRCPARQLTVRAFDRDGAPLLP